MLDNRVCPLCGGHLDWMKVGARELYRCQWCQRQMNEREILDYRQEQMAEFADLCEPQGVVRRVAGDER